MRNKLAVSIFFILTSFLLAFSTFGCQTNVNATGVTPTPELEYKSYLPNIGKVGQKAIGDWRWRIIVGDWGQDEEAAIAWAESFLPENTEYQTAYWPVYPCPEEGPCPLYYRIIFGRWDSGEEAETWGKSNLPDEMDWEVIYFYSRWGK